MHYWRKSLAHMGGRGAERFFVDSASNVGRHCGRYCSRRGHATIDAVPVDGRYVDGLVTMTWSLELLEGHAMVSHT